MRMPFRIDAHTLNDCLIKENNDYTHKPFNPLTPNHQLKKFLIVKQILLVSTLGKFIENSVENMHTYLWVERVKGKQL